MFYPIPSLKKKSGPSNNPPAQPSEENPSDRAGSDGKEGAQGKGLPSFSAIYEKFRKPILHYVRQKLPGQDEDLAEEVTQEVFLKAYRFLPSYQPQYAISTWLWTIARNTVIDWTRSQYARPLLEDRKYSADFASQDSGSDGGIAYEEIPSPSPDAESLMIKKSDRKTLLLWMRALTRKQRMVIKLRDHPPAFVFRNREAAGNELVIGEVPRPSREGGDARDQPYDAGLYLRAGPAPS